jgi:hypothetical protein
MYITNLKNIKNMKSVKIKHRHLGHKKTRRINRRGGMNAKDRATAYAKKRESEREAKLAAAHAVLLHRVNGVSHGARMAVLASGTGSAARHLSDALLHRQVNPSLLRRVSGQPVLDAARPHDSLPAMLDAAGMFQRAEKLCLEVRRLPDADMWSRGAWGEMNCSPRAKGMCEEAAQLYEGAVALKYLPAYAPLAWMMSHADLEKSLGVCDACIAACSARPGAPFSRKAKMDCTALRAYLQYEHDLSVMDEIEMAVPGGRQEVHAMKAPPIEELHRIAKENRKSKYGHALKWLLMTRDDHADRDAINAAQKAAEEMGMDFERCRFCFQDGWSDFMKN